MTISPPELPEIGRLSGAGRGDVAGGTGELFGVVARPGLQSGGQRQEAFLSYSDGLEGARRGDRPLSQRQPTGFPGPYVHLGQHEFRNRPETEVGVAVGAHRARGERLRCIEPASWLQRRTCRVSLYSDQPNLKRYPDEYYGRLRRTQNRHSTKSTSPSTCRNTTACPSRHYWRIEPVRACLKCCWKTWASQYAKQRCLLDGGPGAGCSTEHQSVIDPPVPPL